MTKEEALKILRKDLLSNLVNYYSSEELQDAIDTIVSKPSLPSNLDEAAEEIASDIAPTHPDIGWDVCFEKIKEGIKAGSEWMAGQGVSMLGRVGIYGVDVESITKELREAGFNLGEEIILQIRKKQ